MYLQVFFSEVPFSRIQSNLQALEQSVGMVGSFFSLPLYQIANDERRMFNMAVFILRETL